MRKIKFRAWLKKKDGDEWWGPGMVYFGFREGKREAGFYLHNDRADLLKNAPIMQFTGLHDLEGSEIYEGDIVDFDTLIKTQKAIVIWGDYGWALDYGDDTGDELSVIGEDIITVIGNIYENPELIKELK